MQASVSMLLSDSRSLHFQIAQQFIQDFLIGVVLLPIAKITNIPCAANVICPTRRALLDSIIYANRKQCGCVLFVLFGKSCFHFKSYPRTVDGMLREYQQQFIMQANGLVNAISSYISGFQVFGRIPATYPFALQIGIQTFDKLLIFARIADKAGIILVTFPDEGVNIVYEGVRDAYTLQERSWNVTFRKHNCIYANGRWPFMYHSFKPFDRSQINISKSCPSYLGITEVGITEVGKAEVGKAEVGTVEACTLELGTFEVGTVEVSIIEDGITEIGIEEIGKAEVSIIEFGTVEASIDEIGFAENGTMEVSKFEVGSAKIGTPKVWIYRWLLHPPCVPVVGVTFTKPLNMFLICHLVHLLFNVLIIVGLLSLCKRCLFFVH
jgi:hypothetical protein